MELTLEEVQKSFTNLNEEHAKALAELKTTVMKEIEEKTSKGSADPETKEKIDRLFARLDELDVKLSAPAFNRQKAEVKGVGDRLVEQTAFLEWQKGGYRSAKGMRFPIEGSLFEQKTPIGIGNIGAGTSGVQMPARLTEVVDIQKQRLMIRDLLRVKKLNSNNAVDYLKQNVFTNLASPQVEAAAKAESTITYTTARADVHTIAHFMTLTRQALDDIDWLRSDIDTMLMYGLKLKEETEILSGDGLGDHLNGLITQATAYSSGTYNVSGDTKLDKLRHYILQVRLSLFPADAIVLNPRDLHDIELLKTEEGGANKGLYIVGDPRTGEKQTFLWGKPVVESDSITYGKALVGSFALGAMLFDRMDAVIDISFEHDQNFTKNLATILAEERLALAVFRPTAFVYGSI